MGVTDTSRDVVSFVPGGEDDMARRRGQPLLTVAEVAGLLGMSENWVRDHARGRRHPKLTCVKFARTLRFRLGDVEEFVKNNLEVA